MAEMHELDLAQLEQVEGGVAPVLVGVLIGVALFAAGYYVGTKI